MKRILYRKTGGGINTHCPFTRHDMRFLNGFIHLSLYELYWLDGWGLLINLIYYMCVCVCGIYIFFALNLCFYGFFLSNGILYFFFFLNLISRNGKRMAVTLIRTTWSHNAGLLGEYKCWVLLFRWWQRGGGGRFNCFEFILSRHRLFRRDFLFFYLFKLLNERRKWRFKFTNDLSCDVNFY